ncbi:MAG: polysaccharide deacetylase family protein, partial [Pseudomonadota bacterium]
MRHPFVIWASVLAALAISHPAVACLNTDDALPTSRIVQVDASTGPMFGRISRFASEPQFLREKEVVLTFDDGPSPRLTNSILETLEKFCVKATFFPVGRMAIAYPHIVQAMAKQGHTIGGHTWSHPNNMRRLSDDAAESQIEKGFAAVAAAAGQPIAPFFRFPGLNDDGQALRYLQKREIATFSVDVVSD